MFCSNCGCEVENSKAAFCPSCGKELLQPNVGQPFGRPSSTIQSFVTFKNTRDGRPPKSQLTGKGKKKDVKKPEDEEVIISIGLKVWDANEEKLKEKRGKRLALKVKKDVCYKTLLENAKSKWRDFHRNLYVEGAEYALLLEDNQEALFLPGPTKEFFTLTKYKEAVLKDYKRITLYLCTVDDLEESRSDVDEENEGGTPKAGNKRSIDTSDASDKISAPPAKQNTSFASHANTSPGPSSSNTDSWFLYDELDRLYSVDDSPPHSDNLPKPSPHPSTPDSEASVVKMLEEKVVTDGKISMFIVIRRGVPVNRAITLWQRASQKVNPVHVCRIKFIGEDGIDDGALALEFFAHTVPDIGKTFFPDGSPVYSTNDIASYRAIGEIVAASLAQGGPAPMFLAPCVYDTLASAEGLNYTSTTEDIQKHLTESELKLLEGIREDVAANTDTILEHSYTGPITEAHVESIVAAVTVSLLSRRELMLKELKKGLELYDFATIITKHPQVCKNLFITDRQQPVDPDYLFSLLKPEYSDVGSTRRSIEESVMDNFQDLLFSFEDNSPVSAYTEALAWKAVNADGDHDGDNDDNDGDERFTEADLSPAAVMGWLTGQRHRDITKKIPIYVTFDHDCKKRNPKHSVRACGREITFPVAHMSTADEFKNNFLIAFCKGQAFSRA